MADNELRESSKPEPGAPQAAAGQPSPDAPGAATTGRKVGAASGKPSVADARGGSRKPSASGQAPDAKSDSASDVKSTSKRKPRPMASHAPGAPGKRRIWPRVLVGALCVLVVAAAALVGAFAWDRWWRYDDAADVQGRWYAAGTMVPFEVTSDAFVFDGETSYAYELDTQAKTIRYSLRNLEGEGRYWFTRDRTALVIVDGKGFTATDNAIDDAKRQLGEWWAGLMGEKVALPEGDGVIALTREPDEEAIAARAAAEKAAMEAADVEARARNRARAEALAAEAAEERAAQAEADAEAGLGESESSDEGNSSSDDASGEPTGFANESVGIME